jgi:aconitate hydratase
MTPQQKLDQSLAAAVEKRDATRVAALLKAGASANARDRHGVPVLVDAAWAGNSVIVRLLLDHGAKVEANSDNVNALMWAAFNGHQSVVALLLARGANINARDREGLTPLMFAANGGDLATVAAMLRDNIVHPNIEMTVTPGSRQILDMIARGGVYGDLVAAGARMLEAVCGPCVGVGQAPSAGQPSVRTFNRNFPGRSGTQGDEVYLCSPATAGATALRGVITDPRELGEPPVTVPPSSNPAADDRQILPPLPLNEAKEVEVIRGPNIVPPPPGRPVGEKLEGRVVIVVEDDVSTGDMAPDGALGMSVWSNIAECATYMFRRQDPAFHDRARAWGGGFIVGGHNYGQGSSREHAAIAPVYLGIQAVIAQSFARIHRQNLIAQGVLPLVFADEADYDRTRQGDTWRIDGVRQAIISGATQLTAKHAAGADIVLNMQLLPREREVLLAGGMLKYLRIKGQNPMGIVMGDSRSAESGGLESGHQP